jgi:short-subunit dehydrogenase
MMVGENSKLALVTGASSGIGEAFARRLARDGYDLAVIARRADLLERLAMELAEEYSVNVEVLIADLATEEGISKVEDFTAKAPVSMLVNNAGFSVDGSFMEADFVGQLNMVTVHDIATMRLTRAALPGMLERSSGGIINVASMGGLVPAPYSVTYNATKAFLVMFTECLSQELVGSGIRSQVLCPGFTHTGFHAAMGAVRKLPEMAWMNAVDVVEESLATLEKGKIIFIPGKLNRLNYAFVRALPAPARRWLLRILENISS